MSELIPYGDEPFEPDDPPLIPDFAPVPRKTRRVHGWTPARQRDFIGALEDSGSVTEAARQVNMTPEAAYYLRRAEGAESFRAAWEAAVEIGVRSLTDIAIDRRGMAWRCRYIMTARSSAKSAGTTTGC